LTGYRDGMTRFPFITRRHKPDLAIDLGTANMRIVVPGIGCIFDEPSLCCFEDIGGRSRFMAAGAAVHAMVDRAPKNLRVRRPLARGVLQDIEATSELLKHGLASISGRARRSRPRALIGLPADATKAEANALLAAAEDAGIGQVELVREPFAAAIGAGLPVGEARASMIVECGAGTTEIAVFSIDGQCKTRSVRIGGQHLDKAISEYLQTKHHFLIGRQTAESLKKELAGHSSKSSRTENAVQVKGRDLRTALPGMLTIPYSAFDPVLERHFSRFAEAARTVLGELSPDLAADLLDGQIIATGGGFSARFLADAIERECGVSVVLARDASGCVARGLQHLLES
jgi:rod shape-determining protein MreB